MPQRLIYLIFSCALLCTVAFFQIKCSQTSSCSQLYRYGEGPYQNVQGCFEWVKAFGGYEGGEHPPSAFDFSQCIILTSDGFFELYQDNKVRWKVKYSTMWVDKNNTGDSLCTIKLQEVYLSNQVITIVGKDSIWLSEPMVRDSFSFLFIRRCP